MSEHDEQVDLNEELLAIAQAFLARHEGEGESDDQLLFCRAVKHLQGMAVPMHLAERLVSHAYGILKSCNDRRRLDVAASSETVAVVTDPANGLTWAVPVGLIVKHIINSPCSRKLRLVES
ncbi:hypothetical protein [Pseudomonas vancouverensis]|uniref:Uncharacterized protein n=1 Tax=Pseudomonas vancouverensis TaxID=95300 RepID=A0A1H2P6I0_PSEVA|nr:hypothetical protein [Pseudomonas vancouverensis]KAB0499957.1 hypothetical protein F7R09_01950 [Pseudomonas vancouverensis]TDB68446.1 hypothetical protein EIY72_00920 [Pseudomonas vancouverensis]SDV13270.1 hypothetical protein SAMN05216558_3834 [Pseudomonas vancouverensis]